MIRRLLGLAVMVFVIVWGIPKIFEFLHALPPAVWMIGGLIIFGLILFVLLAAAAIYFVMRNADNKQRNLLKRIDDRAEKQRELWRQERRI